MSKSSINKIKIEVFPRLHLTLIAMHNSGYRKNGGLGFTIRNPKLLLTIYNSPTFEFADSRKTKLSEEEIVRLKESIDSCVDKYNFKKSIAVILENGPLTHSGFGTGTMLKLACLEALFILNKFEYSREQLVKLSGRGGTSGIGINTYFDGGYILDIGHSESEVLRPSSYKEHYSEKAMVVVQGNMPKWELGICIPLDIERKSRKEELDFFENSCPIKDTSVYEILYHILYGVVASFKSNNIENFNYACNQIQLCEWKEKERNQYGEVLEEYENSLKTNGAAAVGMSSLGPSLFFTSQNINSVINKMTEDFQNRIEIFKTEPINRGRIIHYG